ncbi:Demethylmenaquinone methyltransferase [Ruegeria denitrificans]|uniref:Demethylmenaquinone methyltransferase n=1 Tax=Ruegeria denitrificans TaxID=1715692 RepID=A0A0N7MB20_9RHOB|nr:class I SAM-dependent methyltransferase [Ruegeria denitrificans]CUK20683.1 Demethylmenaquinone methyltransferase [Ruegeria denitrificans]
MLYEDFAAAEKSGWAEESKADAYVDLFAPISDQLVPSLSEATRAAHSGVILDLCCGHGNASEALVDAGAEVTGLDFSPAMLARAQNRVPGASFVEGDAADLPFGDSSFDAVVCNVGFGHLPDPDAVLSEISRVLRPDGVAALTSWREPEFSASFQIVFGAVKAHGDPGLAPPAPDFHLFSKREDARRALDTAGLRNPRFTDIDSAFRFNDPSGFADVFENATVRAAMLISSQSKAARIAIREAMTTRVANEFGDGQGGWRVPFPATMVTANA